MSSAHSEEIAMSDTASHRTDPNSATDARAPAVVSTTDTTAAHQQHEQQEGEIEMHIGDYIAFERVAPDKEWQVCMGKVVGLPTPLTVKVALYEAAGDPESRVIAPDTEEELRARAEADGKLDLWDARQQLLEELATMTAAEREATEQLFEAREQTLSKQAAAADAVIAASKELDAARTRVRTVPGRQWRDLRSGASAVPVPEGLQRLMRAVMLVLYEDRTVEWEGIQEVMAQSNFLDRVIAWDCTATPMSVARRRRIAMLCSNDPDVYETAEQRATLTPKRKGAAKKKKGKGGKGKGNGKGEEEESFTIPAKGTDVGSSAALDAAVRQYLSAQITASAAGEEQERVGEECFAEQQEQRTLLREVNVMRTDVSRAEVQLCESRRAITGAAETRRVLPLEAHYVDRTYYKCLYRDDAAGRFIQETLLRSSVLRCFGSAANEDPAGYVRLTPEQHAELASAKRSRNAAHDFEEMQDLLARKEREEAELADLDARLEELRAAEAEGGLDEEAAEELAQLERARAEAGHRHDATLARIVDLYVAGRGTAEVQVAAKKDPSKYTRLQLRIEGDWQAILDDPVQREEMIAAFRKDMARTLGVPEENIFDIDARAGSLLLDFTVKHSGDVDDEELQELVNNGDFSNLTMYYDKVTFKAAAPPPEAPVPEGFPGVCAEQTAEDYYEPDGTLDDGYDSDTLADPLYRQSRITIAAVRTDYRSLAVTGAVERYATDEAPAPEVVEELQKSAAAAAAANGEGELEGGLTETDAVTEGTMPAAVNANTQAGAAAAAASDDETDLLTADEKKKAAADDGNDGNRDDGVIRAAPPADDDDQQPQQQYANAHDSDEDSEDKKENMLEAEKTAPKPAEAGSNYDEL